MDITKYKFYKSLISQTFVQTVWLFGSRARGDNQDRADIDLAVLCPAASIKDWQVLQDIVENADTLLQIDLVRFDELDDPSSLKQAIMQQGIKLYEKP